MGINTVIFDFDGTVIDTNQVVINSWQHTYAELLGRTEPVENIVKTFGEPLSVSMAKAFPGFDADEAVEIYRQYQVKHFEDMIELFPGMDNVMAELKLRGCKIGVVTSRLKRTTVQGLQKFGLDKIIDDLVTCEDTDKHKPDPEPALVSLNNLNSTSNEAIMVGDSMFDIKCAHNAGMAAVLVDWAIAVSHEDREGPDGPEYVIKKASDLLKII